MNMTNSDLFKYDHLTLSVKKVKEDEIINYYKRFGWVLIDKKKHKRYDDILIVSFKRDHFITSKDDILLLEVYFENEINQLGRLEKYRYAKAVSLTVTLVTLVILLVVSGGLFIAFSDLILKIVGIILILCGLTSSIVFRRLIKSYFKKETVRYESKTTEHNYNINKIFDDLEALK